MAMSNGFDMNIYVCFDNIWNDLVYVRSDIYRVRGVRVLENQNLIVYYCS